MMLLPLLVLAAAAAANKDREVFDCGAGAVEKTVSWCVPADPRAADMHVVDTDGDRYYVLGPWSGSGSGLTAYSEAGTPLWQFTAVNMALGASAVLAWDRDALYALRLSSGTIIWSAPIRQYALQLQCSGSAFRFYADRYSPHYAASCTVSGSTVVAMLDEQGNIVNKWTGSLPTYYDNPALIKVLSGHIAMVTDRTIKFMNKTSVVELLKPRTDTVISYENGWYGFAGGYVTDAVLSRQRFLPHGYGAAPSCFHYYSNPSQTVFACDGEVLGLTAFGQLGLFDAAGRLIWYCAGTPRLGLLARRTAAMLVYIDCGNYYNLCVIVR